jgi:quinol monooxygenase YgiN
MVYPIPPHHTARPTSLTGKRGTTMVIVAGHLKVEPADRKAYLEACRHIIEAARTAEGCQDFSLSPDLIDDDRINILERWATAADVERFRGEAPTGPDAVPLLDARVEQYEVTDAHPL